MLAAMKLGALIFGRSVVGASLKAQKKKKNPLA